MMEGSVKEEVTQFFKVEWTTLSFDSQMKLGEPEKVDFQVE